MADETDDDVPRRPRKELPSEFGPLAPLGLPTAPRRAPGEAPRLRLTSSASRRSAPDRPVAAPVPTPPEPPRIPPPATQPAVPRPRRMGWAIAVVCVLLVLAGGVLLIRPGSGPAAEVASATPATSEAPTTGEFDPPVALTSDSEYVETEVLEDGDLLVTHWISTAEPVERFRLRPPSSPGLGDVAVDVEDVVVAVDGVRQDSGDVLADVPFALSAGQKLYVQYRLAGAVDQSGSVGSRGLATVTSLGVGLEGRSLPRTQVFPGGRVMTLACLAQGARAVPESCGTYVEGAWQVSSAAGEVPVTVIAQLDLSITR